MSAFVSNIANLWNDETQNRQIFNWSNILSEWNNSLTMHPYVQTVIDNLKVTSDPNSSYDFPLSHFQKFLNWEREGLTWFIYEVVTMRYMFGGETRLDYVRDLVTMDEVHLDEGFPVFPGSPKNHRTVRQWLENNLSTEELEYVDMMPSLAPSTPVRSSTPAQAEPRAPIVVRLRNSVERDTRPVSTYGQIEIIVTKKNSKQDCQILIKKQDKLFEEHYSLSYTDKGDGFHTKSRNMTRTQILNYLSSTLRLLSVDEEPFEGVQVTLPNAPSVLLPINMDSYSRTLIYDAVEGVMDNWPVRV